MANDRLKVLIVLRPDGSSHYGGDTRLAYELLSAVRTLGVTADLVETESPDARGYDLAHVVNVGEPSICARQMQACERARVPIALSPVWLDVREMFGRGRAIERMLVRERSAQRASDRCAALRAAGNDALLGSRERVRLARREREQAELLARARVLMPNSAAEARDCLVRLGVRSVPMVTVPIAASLEPAASWSGKKSGACVVGRVETRKNQIGMLFGLRDEDIAIDVVGTTGDTGLVDACKRWCPRAEFLGRLSREDLLKKLGSTAVHVMPSWCETAGIANLEAAAAGAQLVVGDRGAEYEYFGDDAEYADPADPESIRDAVRRALSRTPRARGDSLDQRIRRHTWEEAGRETLRAYERALAVA